MKAYKIKDVNMGEGEDRWLFFRDLELAKHWVSNWANVRSFIKETNDVPDIIEYEITKKGPIDGEFKKRIIAGKVKHKLDG